MKSDQLTLKFINPINNDVPYTYGVNTDPNAINNSTQFHMEQDWFNPVNRFTLVLQDDRIDEITSFLERGWKILVCITGKPQMIGYVFNMNISYAKVGGTTLNIECKDILEYLNQGIVYPNFGTGVATNVHFSAQDTLASAINTILKSFIQDSKEIATSALIDNHQFLTFATGFNTGIKQRGKTPKSRIKNIQSNLKRLTTPNKGETYLAYLLRLIKMAGCEIKAYPDQKSLSNIIVIKPPTYDRESSIPYKLIHSMSDAVVDNQQNNVISASINFSLEKQPSVVIVEANTTDTNTLYQSTLKGIAINNLVSYDFDRSTFPFHGPPIDNVNNAINQLTNFKLGTQYSFADFNDNLWSERFLFPIDIATKLAMPYYITSNNAHNEEEVAYAASKLLAEKQDKYVEMHYRVAGWSTSEGYIWAPDQMVNVKDDILNVGNGSTGSGGGGGGNPDGSFPMWIRKVNYIKSKAGTFTDLTLTLPYTHDFDIINTKQ